MSTFAQKNVIMENSEEILRKDLHQFLLSMKEVDERLPECPDVEEKWEEIARAWHKRGIQRLCRLSAPALSDGSRYAAETDGLSHDEDELI